MTNLGSRPLCDTSVCFWVRVHCLALQEWLPLSLLPLLGPRPLGIRARAGRLTLRAMLGFTQVTLHLSHGMKAVLLDASPETL